MAFGEPVELHEDKLIAMVKETILGLSIVRK